MERGQAKFNIRLSDRVYDQLSALADECGVSISDLIREGIGQVLNAAVEARATGMPTLAILAPLAWPRPPSDEKERAT